ncbi:MAG TPA: DUF5413 family protein [Nitrobacter sp.]|nr:DUF5413 family protein [Nitrobacter sp.]
MKRYVIFVLVGPAVGGLLLLLATTIQSGYWVETSLSEVKQFVFVLLSTLQFSYLFGLLPCLAVASVDDILSHVSRIGPVLRMLMIGVIGFAVAELLYGSRGPDSGVLQFLMYGLVGFVPATLSSWWSRGVLPHQPKMGGAPHQV